MKTFKLLNAVNNFARFHMAIIKAATDSTSCYDCPSPFMMNGSGRGVGGGFENSNLSQSISLTFILIPCVNGPIKRKLVSMQSKTNHFDLKSV